MGEDDRPAGGATGTQAIDRGLTVLTLLAERPMTVRDLSERTGLPRSTVSRLLGALERFRLATRADGGVFRLGTGTLTLAARWHHQSGMIVVATPHLERLVRATGETVQLAIPEGLHAVIAAYVESPRPIRLSYTPGARFPLHAGAHGKTLLAFAPDWVLDSVLAGDLRPVTPRTITDVTTLRRQLEEIRRQGYAESHEEVDTGAYALVAPIRAAEGEVIAAVGVSGPTARILEVPTDELKREVLQCAAAISKELGATG
jgi:DNA-binding IclR family transcriptional regulator